MIVYHGSIKKIEQFNKEILVQKLSNDIDTIGIWFTSDTESAKPFAFGTETVIQKSDTEFWEDGEPKVVQFDREVRGFIYKVYMDEPNLKEYHSDYEDTYDLFMKERDKYCDYLGAKKTWKDKAILLNKEEANTEFRKYLIRQGYEGLVVRNTKLNGSVTDMFCIFSGDALHIVDVISVDE
ncbi:hypothetical protein [Neobacillus terrae]|uniref:hypothetical protein n=1 Tax=Neobacillus terrae TaxID=3034837 RepID=UPI00140CB393|nr:hypothetical protein [Neobacillus terrae]NHM31974.1 hypothetical protein [Neobacillus terrae]